jgi:hypothetical protein
MTTVNRGRPIIFAPFGMGILDLAVGTWVYNQAVASGQSSACPTSSRRPCDEHVAQGSDAAVDSMTGHASGCG